MTQLVRDEAVQAGTYRGRVEVATPKVVDAEYPSARCRENEVVGLEARDACHETVTQPSRHWNGPRSDATSVSRTLPDR